MLSFAPCEVIQEVFGFQIPLLGFRIPLLGFHILDSGFPSDVVRDWDLGVTSQLKVLQNSKLQTQNFRTQYFKGASLTEVFGTAHPGIKLIKLI
jgi:hypothetical protein